MDWCSPDDGIFLSQWTRLTETSADCHSHFAAFCEQQEFEWSLMCFPVPLAVCVCLSSQLTRLTEILLDCHSQSNVIASEKCYNFQNLPSTPRNSCCSNIHASVVKMAATVSLNKKVGNWPTMDRSMCHKIFCNTTTKLVAGQNFGGNSIYRNRDTNSLHLRAHCHTSFE